MTLDNTKFVSCSFTNCRLRYAGGYVDFIDCSFDGLQMEFSGAAANTAQVMSALGMLTPKMFVLSTS